MQQFISADFDGTPLSIIDHDGRKWLAAEQVGRCLGYDESNARKGVMKLYERHGDEFTGEDTTIVKLTTVDRKLRAVRFFSASGCVTLAWLSNTTRAKEFKQWAKHNLAEQMTGQKVALSFDEVNAVMDAAKDGEIGREAREAAARLLARFGEPQAVPAVSAQQAFAVDIARKLADELGEMRRTIDAQGAVITALYGKVEGAQRAQISALRSLATLRQRQATREAVETVIRLEAQGVPRAEIVALTGKTLNHVKQIVFQARASGRLPPLASTQGELALESRQ